jgi:hypothetical protein
MKAKIKLKCGQVVEMEGLIEIELVPDTNEHKVIITQFDNPFTEGSQVLSVKDTRDEF